MKINRIPLLSIVIILAFANKVQAENCVWDSSLWLSDKITNGVTVQYNCYTDSSHSTMSSSTSTLVNLSQNDGWRVDTETGNIYNENNSSVSYSLDTVSKQRKLTSTYENGKQTSYHTTSYQSDGMTKENEYTYTYENSTVTSTHHIHYQPDGVMKDTESTHTYENGQETAHTTFYQSDGTKGSEKIEKYENGKKTLLSNIAYQPDGLTKSSESTYTYHDDTIKTYSYTVYESDGKTMSSFSAYENDTDGNRISYEELVNRNGSQQFMKKNYTHENGITSINTQYSDLNNKLIESFETSYECDYEGCNAQMITHKDANGRILDIEEKVLEAGQGLEINGCDTNKLKCIKAYRTATGIGLSEAKTAILAIIAGDYASLDDLSADQIENLQSQLNNIDGVTATSSQSWITKNILTYSYNDNGGYQVTNTQGEIIESYQPQSIKSIKRIYTVEEATAAVKGNKNTFSIRYR